MPFTPRSEHDLARLGDDALVAHLRAARAAGDAKQFSLTLRLLVAGRWDRVVQRVGMKVPEADVDDVAGEVIWSTLTASFDGTSMGEFVNWLNTITKRRIAEYHRRRRGTPAMVAIGLEEDDPTGGSVEPADVSMEGYVEAVDLVAQALASMSELHTTAVKRHVFDGVPARDVAAELGISPGNVAQIASRFRRSLRAALRESENR